MELPDLVLDSWMWTLITNRSYIENFKNKVVNADFNVHSGDELLFRLLCMYGNLAGVKWLYYFCLNKNSPIDIHANYEGAFSGACQANYVHVVDWLYELSCMEGNPIDIRMNDQIFFKIACANNSTKMIEWLYVHNGCHPCFTLDQNTSDKIVDELEPTFSVII